MGAHLKCLTLASIVALRCQAAPVATSSFRRKFYFTQIRVNLASEKLPKDQSTTSSRSRRQSGAKDLPLPLATTTDLCLRSSFIFMCLSVCVCMCAAGQEFNKPASVTPIPISLPLSLSLILHALPLLLFTFIYTLFIYLLPPQAEHMNHLPFVYPKQITCTLQQHGAWGIGKRGVEVGSSRCCCCCSPAKWKPKCSFIEKLFSFAMQRVQHVACFVSHAAPRKMVSIVVYYSKQGATREESSIRLAPTL